MTILFIQIVTQVTVVCFLFRHFVFCTFVVVHFHIFTHFSFHSVLPHSHTWSYRLNSCNRFIYTPLCKSNHATVYYSLCPDCLRVWLCVSVLVCA